MAKNLRAKINDSDSLIVYDITTAAVEKLQKEAGNVDAAKSVREVAEKAVCRIVVCQQAPTTPSPTHYSMMIYLVLSMI